MGLSCKTSSYLNHTLVTGDEFVSALSTVRCGLHRVPDKETEWRTSCIHFLSYFKSKFTIKQRSVFFGVMLRSKVFVKKTRKGGVMKIVREHYLRDDVWCRASHCRNCAQTDQNLLDSSPHNSSKLYTFPHYLLPDTNVVLHQIDVLEDPVFTNVILLQTVLQEVSS